MNLEDDRSTIIVDKYRDAGTVPLHASYKGLQMHALPGLHAFTAARVVEHVAVNSKVLDLASGSGAMCLRLADSGFRMTATDYVVENFKLHKTVPFVTANLNENFSADHAETYDAIVAQEIIEHLENPRHFARQCHRILAAGGKIVLTTPNVDNPASIASFITSGNFFWFADNDYRTEGHISPMTQWTLRKCFEEAGFSFLWEGSYGTRASRLAGSPRLNILAKLIELCSGTDRNRRGEIYVAVLEKR